MNWSPLPMFVDGHRLGFAAQAFQISIDEALTLAGDSSSSSAVSAAALRGSLMLGVSAFDFLVHEIVRVSIVAKVENGERLEGVEVPISILSSASSRQAAELDLHIRKKNSYRSFVSTSNVKEALKPVIVDVWSKVSSGLGVDAQQTKNRVDKIWTWRNRIAHEADFVPSNDRFERWGIFREDVLQELQFLEAVGHELYRTVSNEM